MGPGTLGRYTLVERIKTGGMAEIWSGFATGPGGFLKKAAIKVVLPCYSEDPEFLTMFMDEAAIASRLSHANIAQIYDFAVADGKPYLAMEFVEGRDLHAILERASERGGPIPWALACAIAMETAKGLYYVHTRREASRPLCIIHRDISPRNIMISFSGEVKIVDFGIARSSNRSTVTQAGEVKGKCAYMSPEQALGRMVDPRTDIFSLGVVLFEMLTGRRLFGGGTQAETLTLLLRTEVPPPHLLVPEIPEQISQIVLTALKKEPGDRFPTMLALYEALSRQLFLSNEYPGAPQLSWYIRDLFPDMDEDGPPREELEGLDLDGPLEITVSESDEWERRTSPGTVTAPMSVLDLPPAEPPPPQPETSSFRRWDKKEITELAQGRPREKNSPTGRSLLYILLGILLAAGAMAAWNFILGLDPVPRPTPPVESAAPAVEPTPGVTPKAAAPLQPEPASTSGSPGDAIVETAEEGKKDLNSILDSPEPDSLSQDSEVQVGQPADSGAEAEPQDQDLPMEPGKGSDSDEPVPPAPEIEPREEVRRPAPKESVPRAGKTTPTKAAAPPESLPTEPAPKQVEPRAPGVKAPAGGPKKEGRIRITARPWADVRIDGVSRGTTPLNLRLPEGHHEVVLSNLDSSHTCRIDLRPDEPATCSWDFTPPAEHLSDSP